MSWSLTLLLAIFIAVFTATTLSFILIYHNTSKNLEKNMEKRPTKQGLDLQTIERLKNTLIGKEEIQNLEEIIHRLRMLRKEAEEILHDSGRS